MTGSTRVVQPSGSNGSYWQFCSNPAPGDFYNPSWLSDQVDANPGVHPVPSKIFPVIGNSSFFDGGTIDTGSRGPGNTLSNYNGNRLSC